jgi:hypothetical protein
MVGALFDEAFEDFVTQRMDDLDQTHRTRYPR